MTKKILLLLLILMSMANTAGCANAVRVDGPYEGRIIDAETGQPIEGVVVLGVWTKEIVTPGGATNEFYDAQETLTDKNGEFKLQGMGTKILSMVTPMNVLIFKSGYEHFGYGPWVELQKSKYLKRKMGIKWDGNRVIIPLKQLTLDERKNRFGSYYVRIPDERKQMLLREIEKEKKEIGQQ